MCRFRQSFGYLDAALLTSVITLPHCFGKTYRFERFQVAVERVELMLDILLCSDEAVAVFRELRSDALASVL
jgi:hypothetical protein